MELPEILSFKDVMLHLKVSRNKAYEEMRRMRHIRLGRNLRVRREDYLSYLDENTVEPET